MGKDNENYKIDKDEIIELDGDAGEVMKFHHIATIDHKGEWFVFFQPSEPINGIDPEEVVIFKIANVDGEDVLLPIDDEALLDEVYEIFVKEYYDDEEDYDGEEEETESRPSCAESCSRCGGCNGKFSK